MVAAVAVAIGVLPALQFDHVGFVALVGAALAVGMAARGWRAAGRADDTRFATLAITAAGSLALAAAKMLPFAGWASAAALLCAAMMTLAGLANDRRIERGGWGFCATTMALLGSREGIARLFGEAGSGHFATWIVPAMVGLGLAIRATGTRAAVMQPAAVLIG